MFGSGDLPWLKSGLDAAWQTQNEVSHNLVNAESPDFVPRVTDFRALLLQGASRPPRGEAYRLFLREVGKTRLNLERELARLSRSTLEHAALARLLTARYRDLRTAITEGRR